jgi:hypothetical protein
LVTYGVRDSLVWSSSVLLAKMLEERSPRIDHLTIPSEFDLHQVQRTNVVRPHPRSAGAHQGSENIHPTVSTDATILEVPRNENPDYGTQDDRRQCRHQGDDFKRHR